MSIQSLAQLQRRQLGRLSPFSIFRFFRPTQNQPLPIKPVQIPAAANASLVHHARNPKKCTCGWYHFYGKCGLLYQRYAGTCGRTTTTSGRSGFCTTPAPKNVVYGYYVNEKCTNAKCTVCRRRGHKVGVWIGSLGEMSVAQTLHLVSFAHQARRNIGIFLYLNASWYIPRAISCYFYCYYIFPLDHLESSTLHDL